MTKNITEILPSFTCDCYTFSLSFPENRSNI